MVLVAAANSRSVPTAVVGGARQTTAPGSGSSAHHPPSRSDPPKTRPQSQIAHRADQPTKAGSWGRPNVDTGGEFGVRSIFPQDPSGIWLDRGLRGRIAPFLPPVVGAATID